MAAFIEILKRLISKATEHFYFVGATIISAGIHFLYSIYVKAHIEPLEYGMYSTCMLLNTYLAYAQLGSLNSFNRDYPQIIGAGDKEKAKVYRNTTFTFLLCVFSTIILLASAVIITVGVLNGTDKRYIIGLLLCTLVTATTTIENFLNSRVRIDGGFKYVSIVIITELLSVGLGYFLIPRIGYYGLYFVTIGSMIIGIIMYYRKGISDICLKINKKTLHTMITSGLPLLISGLIWTVVDSIDKFVILGFMDAERLGFYSIAQMVFSYMILIPSAMSQLFYVNLGKVYGANRSNEELNRVALRYTLIISVVISFLVISAFFLIRPAVALLMPKYLEGVSSAQILMIGLAIYAPTMVNGNILTILKKNATLLRGSVYICVLNILLSIGFVKVLGIKIENVALGTAISYVIRTMILIVQLKREAGADVIDMIKASILPVLVISGPGMIIYFNFNHEFTGLILSLLTAGIVVLLIYYKQIYNYLKRNLI